MFERCRLFKLRMNPLKNAFGVSAGKVLGFLVHSREIDIDLAKAVAIVTMKPSAMVKELKSFLGKVSYIRRFIPSLVSIISAFIKLLKNRQSFNWGGGGECIAESFSKATTDYDEPPHSASSNP